MTISTSTKRIKYALKQLSDFTDIRLETYYKRAANNGGGVCLTGFKNNKPVHTIVISKL